MIVFNYKQKLNKLPLLSLFKQTVSIDYLIRKFSLVIHVFIILDIVEYIACYHVDMAF